MARRERYRFLLSAQGNVEHSLMETALGLARSDPESRDIVTWMTEHGVRFRLIKDYVPYAYDRSRGSVFISADLPDTDAVALRLQFPHLVGPAVTVEATR